MDNKKLQKRLKLLDETNLKIESMRKRNVFSLDTRALDILIRLSKEFQEILLENLDLKKEIKSSPTGKGKKQ